MEIIVDSLCYNCHKFGVSTTRRLNFAVSALLLALVSFAAPASSNFTMGTNRNLADLQIGLDPETMLMVEGIDAQIHRVFKNLAAVAHAAGGSLANAVRLTVFLTDLGHFARVNEIMAEYVPQPYPARASLGVASLTRGGLVEVDVGRVG